MKNLRWVATLAVFVLVAAACGRSGDSNNTTATTTGGGSGTTQSTAAQTQAGSFGDLKNVCGPKPAGATLTATDTGVTADTVQVSTVSDPGFSARPGLNQEMFDSATAFSKWCNAQGGISGRKIKSVLRDAKLTQFQQVALQACEQKDFMMVGGGAVFDDQGQTARLGCGLPTVAGYVVTPQATSADLTYQPVPNPTQLLSVGDFVWLAKTYPDAVKHAAIMTGNIPTTELVAKRYKEAVIANGWNVVKEITYNAFGETTWRPDAEALHNAGVKALLWVGEPTFFADMLKAVADAGFKLDFARMDANGYDPGLLTEGGSAANGAVIRSVFWPFLTDADAAKNPATVQYREIVKKYTNGKGKIAYLGVQGFSAWLLWAKAATACGANLTRDCVWANIAKVKDWTGGGLHAKQDPADDRPSDCFALEKVDNGKFVLADTNPNQGIYACDPSYLYHVKLKQPAGAKCPNPAFASDPVPSKCANS